MAEINKLPDNSPEPENKATKKNNKSSNESRIKKWFRELRRKLKKWFRELRSELKKVTWPTRKQVINNTFVALVVMAVSAVCLWGFDTIASLTVSTLIRFLG